MIFIYIIFVIITTIYHCKSQQLTMAYQQFIDVCASIIAYSSYDIPGLSEHSNGDCYDDMPRLSEQSNGEYKDLKKNLPYEIKSMSYLNGYGYDNTKYKPNKLTEIVMSSCDKTVNQLIQNKFTYKSDDNPHILHIKDNVNVSSELDLIWSKGNITKLTLINMFTLTDEELTKICSMKQPNLTHICIENCPLITSIPDNVYAGSPLLTHLHIKDCKSFEEIPSLVSLTILNTLIISGDMLSCVFLPDNLWHLNETLQYIKVPHNTHFHQILVNSLKKSLLPDTYKPDVVQARNTLIREHTTKQEVRYELFKLNEEFKDINNIERRERQRIFRIEQDRERHEFMLSVEYKAETIARMKEAERKSDDDVEVVD